MLRDGGLAGLAGPQLMVTHANGRGQVLELTGNGGFRARVYDGSSLHILDGDGDYFGPVVLGGKGRLRFRAFRSTSTRTESRCLRRVCPDANLGKFRVREEGFAEPTGLRMRVPVTDQSADRAFLAGVGGLKGCALTRHLDPCEELADSVVDTSARRVCVATKGGIPLGAGTRGVVRVPARIASGGVVVTSRRESIDRLWADSDRDCIPFFVDADPGGDGEQEVGETDARDAMLRGISPTGRVQFRLARRFRLFVADESSIG